MEKILTPFAVQVFEARCATAEVIDVVAAQVRIAVRGQNFQRGHRGVSGWRYRRCLRRGRRPRWFRSFVCRAVVGQRGSRRFIHQPQHFQPGDSPGVLSSLPLSVVEIGGNGNDGFIDGLTQERFSVLLQLAQDVGGDLRRSQRAILAQLEANDQTRYRRLRGRGTASVLPAHRPDRGPSAA